MIKLRKLSVHQAWSSHLSKEIASQNACLPFPYALITPAIEYVILFCPKRFHFYVLLGSLRNNDGDRYENVT